VDGGHDEQLGGLALGERDQLRGVLTEGDPRLCGLIELARRGHEQGTAVSLQVWASHGWRGR
jgi:hypothetical protein